MNILITSAGRRSYLIRYFKEALGCDGEVHAANSTPDSPAFFYADKSVITPLIYDKDYISFLMKYCEDNPIGVVISLFDIDLPVLSKHKKDFERLNVKLIISDENVINICNDKWATYQFLKSNNFNVPASFLRSRDAINSIVKGDISYPLIIKPRWGMGSIGIQQAESEEELYILYEKVKRQIFASYLSFESIQDEDNCVIIQEMLSGQEYGLDVINDLNGCYQNTIVKKKLAMRSGETDSAITVDSPALKNLGKSLSDSLKHVANLDVDVFLVNDATFVLEMNARFGGGYPFSHLAGVELPKAIIQWIRRDNLFNASLEAQIGIVGYKDIEPKLFNEK